MNESIINITPKICECGCGEIIKKNRRFVYGHHIRVNNPNIPYKKHKKYIKPEYPLIPTICRCGCNEVVWGGKEWKVGHISKINHPMKKDFYPIPSLCECGCGETTWNGNRFIKGHHSRVNNCMSRSEVRNKLRMANIGKHYSEETKKKISISKSGSNHPNYGRHLSEKTKKKIGDAQRGEKSHWWGRSMPDEIKRKISDSEKGKKLSPEHKKKISVSNKGKPPEQCHNYGKHLSEETKKRISESNKGRIVDDETRKKMSIINKGRKRSDEFKKKLSKYHKGRHEGKDNCMFGKKLSPKHKKQISDAIKGENAPNWKGGISYFPYCHKFNKRLKELIRNRDNRTCQLCDTKENGKKLRVHHVHYDKENCYPDLISLCHSCHSKVNFNREHYENLFMNKLNERGLLFWTKLNSE